MVAPQRAEVAGLTFDNAAGVVIGEWVLGVFGFGFGLVDVAITERPWVWGDCAGDSAGSVSSPLLCFGARLIFQGQRIEGSCVEK